MTKKAVKRDIVNMEGLVVKSSDFTTKYRYDDVEVHSSNIDLCYMLLHVDRISTENGLSYAEVLLILYLYELGIFSHTMKLHGDNTMAVYSLERKGYVESEYVNNKKLYSLSLQGILLVKDFFKQMSDNAPLISKNRKAILDTENRASSILSRYFRS